MQLLRALLGGWFVVAACAVQASEVVPVSAQNPFGLALELTYPPELEFTADGVHATAFWQAVEELPPAIVDPAPKPKSEDKEKKADEEDKEDGSEKLFQGHEPGWIEPAYWVYAKLWSGSFQVGLAGSEGNSQTTSITTGYDVKRESPWSILTSDLTYTKATSNGIETKHNALFNSRLEWLMPDSPWTMFQTLGMEYDEFKAFDLRLFGNAGAGYRFIKTPTTKLTGRLGGGVSHEFNSPDTSYPAEALFGLEGEHRFNKWHKIRGKVEYFPQWDDFNSFRVITDAGWEMLLSRIANLSLKIGLIDRYDSTPNGRLPNDLNYNALLLWKL